MGRKEEVEKSKTQKIDLELVKQAIKLMDENGLAEFIYEVKDLKIGLKKAVASSFVQPQILNIPNQAAPAVTQTPLTSEAKKEVNENLYTVKSPMVGTFYRAPSPDSPPFVNIGDTVEPGKTLCIIEAMKIMNEIKAEVKGVVKEILVENAQAVEYNQPLIVIEKK